MSLPNGCQRHLTTAQVAEILGTSERFPRRLIAERRIAYVKAGKHVRIPQSALDDYIATNTITPTRPGIRIRGKR